jgi:hypothetical protein
MNRRPSRGWPVVVLALLLHFECGAVDLKKRSISSSGQFIVYCENRDLRTRLVSFVEDTRAATLRLLHEADAWSIPIVVSVEPQNPDLPLAPPATVALVSTIVGPKLDVAVRVGDDPSRVFLQRHIIRAVLLEMAYRDRPPIRGGERYFEPPWWLAEGIAQSIQKLGADRPEVFRSIVNTERLPSLDKFLGQPPIHLDTAAGMVDRACALSLVEALLRLQNGPAALGRFIRSWPDAHGDAIGALQRHFPALATSEQGLAKWWTLQLAQLAKPGGLQTTDAAAADKELAAALELEITTGKDGTKRHFQIADFGEYMKLSGARSALRTAQVKIVTLSTRSEPLFQPVLAEYEEICRLLSIGKTRGIAARLGDSARYRKTLVQRREQITDYLNWYEATQPPGKTGQFDSYLRTAESFTSKQRPPLPVDPAILRYLDSMEDEFAPLRPDMIPGLSPAGSAAR